MFEFLQRHPRVARIAEIAGSAVLLNLMMLLAAATIIGLAPALAAGFSYALRVVRRQTVDIVEHFIRPLKTYFLSAWILVLMDVTLLGAAIANLALVMNAEIPLGGVAAILGVLIAALVLCANLLLWPLLVTSEASLRNVVVLAVRLTLGHLPWSLTVLACCLAIAWLTIAYPLFGGIVGVGAITLIAGWGGWQVIRRYQAANTTLY